ncbi:MAG: 3-isopropylmalate dehydratase large subunit, partial [Candidatus Thorarchaeota archaeon]
MGATIAEKIIAAHSSSESARPGEIVQVKVDFLMVHEVLGSRILTVLEEMGVDAVWDSSRILVVNDHWGPASNT